MVDLRLEVNGTRHDLQVEPRLSLLGLLRDGLDLTGAKYGCGEGQCGACVVLLDGVPVPSCVTPVEAAAGRRVETVEGLAPQATAVLRERPDGSPPVATLGYPDAGMVGELHPVQRAFLEDTALQCGYCTPGMIMRAVALLRRTPHPSGAEIRRELEGHICRCGSYGRIVRAVQRAAGWMSPPGAPGGAGAPGEAGAAEAGR